MLLGTSSCQPGSTLPKHMKCPTPRGWQAMDIIYAATASTV